MACLWLLWRIYGNKDKKVLSISERILLQENIYLITKRYITKVSNYIYIYLYIYISKMKTICLRYATRKTNNRFEIIRRIPPLFWDDNRLLLTQVSLHNIRYIISLPQLSRLFGIRNSKHRLIFTPVYWEHGGLYIFVHRYSFYLHYGHA